jgi:hypothetical protein
MFQIKQAHYSRVFAFLNNPIFLFEAGLILLYFDQSTIDLSLWTLTKFFVLQLCGIHSKVLHSYLVVRGMNQLDIQR